MSKRRAAQREEGPQAFVGSGQQSEAEAELRRLRRDFSAPAPDRKWLGDISYIATKE